MNTTRERMTELGIRNVDLIRELQKRGIEVSPPEMSNVLNGVLRFPKSQKILAECEKILDEHEHAVV